MIKVGIDCLREQSYRLLQGASVALVTNHTGVASDGRSTVDLVHQAPGVRLKALFGPEHGVRGALDGAVGDGRDAKTGLPVYSMYGARLAPSPEQLAGIDALVFDIQDIGCRFYTYISTLGHMMGAAEGAGIRVVVLDRPNPIGGDRVEGSLPDPDKLSFTAFHPIAIRHGMTVGEMARMMQAERFTNLSLDVVRCEGWRREDWFDATGLRWIDPSPNMRSLTAAALYPGVGLLEFTNLSVGRGTATPFEVIGAPYLNGARLANGLDALGLPDIAFDPIRFTPEHNVFSGEPCEGVRFRVVNREAMRPVRLGLAVSSVLRQRYPEWQTEKLITLLANDAVRDATLTGSTKATSDLLARDEDAFRRRRECCLIY